MEEIKIIEYDKKYAKSLADMWNMSSESWGGFDSIFTEESVIKENKNSGKVNTYIALNGEDVVGCFSLSEYMYDEGALYIPMLNVRPDYRGKKVGKALVKQAVKKTLELGWPRLDLYSCIGSTKAVPFYKKSGFFCEKREDNIHLMNFIPTVLQIDAVKDYFEFFDWYEDCKRNIEVKPDDTKEDEFSKYDYIWQKSGRYLRLGFERKGRCLRLIETDDYIISADIQNCELVFGREYSIYYNIVNKSGKKLDISIEGKNNKNIRFSYDAFASIKKKKTFTARFFVDSIEEEQNLWRTHPYVAANIKINGKSALFGVGIKPKFPAQLSLSVPKKHKLKDLISEFYIDIENNFDEDAIFEFELPESVNLIIQNRRIIKKLTSKEKASISVKYTLNKPFSYEALLNIKAKLSNNIVEFKKKVSLYFTGYDNRFGGENEEFWSVHNGSYSLHLSKSNNDLILKRNPEINNEIRILFPRIGLPFSLEFSKEKPHNVENYCEDNGIVLKAFYSSREFKDIQVISISKLYANGLVEHNYVIQNISDVDTDRDIWLNTNYYYKLINAVIPYDKRYIKIHGYDSANLSKWESSKFTENWIFSQDKDSTSSICWPINDKVKLNNQFYSFDINLGKIPAKSSIFVEPSFLSIDTFKDWKELRRFALKDDRTRHIELNATEKLEFNINNGNPFVDKYCDIKVKDYRNVYFSGGLKLRSENNSFEKVEKKFSAKDLTNEALFSITTEKLPKVDVLTLDVDFETMIVTRKSLIFKIGDNALIEEKKYIENGLEVLSLENGEITIKTSLQFSNNIYSLVYNSKEWLDNSFPRSSSKSSWVGGILTRPSQMTSRSFDKEKSKANFIKLNDMCGNTWSGIVIKTKINKNDRFKGLKIAQYYLMLPGLPILCHTAEIIQETGKYFSSTPFVTNMYVKLGEEYKDNLVSVKDLSGQLTKYRASIDYEGKTEGSVVFSGVNRKSKMIVHNNGDAPLHCFTNNQVIGAYKINKVDAENNSKVFLPPCFIIFNKEEIEDALLKNLQNIKFAS